MLALVVLGGNKEDGWAMEECRELTNQVVSKALSMGGWVCMKEWMMVAIETENSNGNERERETSSGNGNGPISNVKGLRNKII